MILYVPSVFSSLAGGPVPQPRRSRSREPSVRLVRAGDSNLLAAAQAAAEAVRAPSPAASNVTEVSEMKRVVGGEPYSLRDTDLIAV